jgi:hypothetical protein
MLQRLLSGTALALCAAFVLLIGGGSDLEHVALLGVALGGVVGLVPHNPPLGKLGGFFLGFVLAWIAFGVRAALLPDTTMGRAVAAFIVVLLCGIAAALSAGRVPLWSALLGVAAMVGAYELPFTDSPPQFMVTSPPAATTVLFAAGFGFIVATLIDLFVKADAPPTRGSSPAPTSTAPTNDPELMARLLTGESK